MVKRKLRVRNSVDEVPANLESLAQPLVVIPLDCVSKKIVSTTKKTTLTEVDEKNKPNPSHPKPKIQDYDTSDFIEELVNNEIIENTKPYGTEENSKETEGEMKLKFVDQLDFRVEKI